MAGVPSQARARLHPALNRSPSGRARRPSNASRVSEADRTIGEEEKVILWRSLERIPMIYREPLVLFYREHQSIETVARDLELSEDAVKQRLSRGRKLLQEQIYAFIAGALKQTSSGTAFTLGVVAAVTLLPTSAKAATAAAAGSGGSAAPLAGGGKAGALLLNGMMALIALLGVSGIAGRWVGREMRRMGERSLKGRRRVAQFWFTLTAAFTVLVLPSMLVPSMNRSHHWLYHAATWSWVAFYGVVAAALAVWIWRRWRDARRPDNEPTNATGLSIKPYRRWVAWGMVGPALILGKFVIGLFSSASTHTIVHYDQIPAAAAWRIISEHKGGSDANYFWRADADARKIISERNNARFMVNQYQDGSKFLLIRQQPNSTILYTPWDDSLMAALAERGIAYKIQLVGGAPLNGDVVFRYGGLWSALKDQGGRFLRIFSFWQIHHDDLRQWLVALSTAIMAAGSVLCLRRPDTQGKRPYALTID
jgi:hypothetical protein